MAAAARAPRSLAEAVLLSTVAALLAGAVLAGGGSRATALTDVGLAALAGATVGLSAALLGLLPLARLDRAGRLVVLGATGLALWVGLSTVWSIAGDRSWEWLGRGL